MKQILPLLLAIALFSCKKDTPLDDKIADFTWCNDTIFAAGNSLTADLGAEWYTDYPSYLAQMLGRDPGTIINSGVSGDISTSIADRYLNRTVGLHAALLGELGSNNNWSAATVKADIKRIIGNSKKYFILDIATGNLPDRWPGHESGYYDHNEKLNDEIEAMVGPDHFIRIKDYLQLHMDGSHQDSVDVFINDCEPSSLHADFIHRNSKGNYWMARAIAERLVPCKNDAAKLN